MIKLLAVSLALVSGSVMALPQCDAAFPSVLQSHSGGKLTLAANSDIIGETDRLLEFTSQQFANNGSNDHCDNQECQISGTSSVPLVLPTVTDPNDFPAGTNAFNRNPGGNFSCSSGSVNINNKLRYRTVTISGNCQARINNTNYIETLNISAQGRLLVDEGSRLQIETATINTTNNSGGIASSGNRTIEIVDLTMLGQSRISASSGTLTLKGFGDWLLSDNSQLQGQLLDEPLQLLRVENNAKVELSQLTAETVQLRNQADVRINDGGAVAVEALSLTNTAEILSSGSERIRITGYGDVQLLNQNNSQIEFQPHYYRNFTVGANAGAIHWAGGDYTFASVGNSGAGYFGDDFIVHGDAKWVINSGLTLQDGQHFTPTDGSAHWQLFVNGDVTLTQQAQFTGLLYASGQLTMSNQAKVTGAAAATSVILNNNAQAVRDDAVVPDEIRDLCEPDYPDYFRAFRVGLGVDDSATIEIKDYDHPEPPLVFLSSPTKANAAGSQLPADVAVTAVSKDEVSIVVWTPTQNKGGFRTVEIEYIDVLVVSPGKQQLISASGDVVAEVEAGVVATCAVRGKYTNRQNGCANADGARVNFETNFAQAPGFLVQIQGQANGNGRDDFLTARAVNLNSNRVDIGLDSNELSPTVDTEEQIAWLAVAGSGEVMLNGEVRRLETRTDVTNHTFDKVRSPQQQCETQYDVAWNQPFPSPPLTFGNKRTRSGGDGGWTRFCKVTENVINVILEEDLAHDSDQSHVSEQYGIVAIEAPTDELHFYHISHDGAGVTCLPETITIKACLDRDCNTLLDDAVSVGLTFNDGTLGTQTLTFTGETSVNVWHPDPSDLSAPLQIGLNVNDNGSSRCFVAGLESSECAIAYQNAALQLTAPPALGCKQHSIGIQAVIASATDPLQCDPLFTGEQDLTFALAAVSPAAPVGSPEFTLNGSALPLGSSQVRQLTFDEFGAATIPYQYSDVGRLQLSASYQQSPNGQPIELAGNTNLDLLPVGFHISSAKACSSADASCAIAAAAGQDFDLNVTAACYQQEGDTDFSDNPVAQNFIHSGFSLQTQLLSPAGGQNNSVMTNAVFAAAAQGRATIVTQSDEVGAFRWQPQLDIGYLGGSISKDRYSSDAIGRFTPAYLQAEQNSPQLQGFCNDMSYFGQQIGFKPGLAPMLTIKGYAIGGSETQNYRGEYWDFGATSALTAADAGAPAGVLVSAPSPLNNLRDNDAQTLLLNNALVSYSRADSPHVPYDGLTDLTVTAASVTDADGICVRASATGSCETVTFAAISGNQWRDGRIELRSVFGSETQPLRLPLQAQFFNSSGRYQTNLDDSCTVINDIELSDGSTIASTGALLSQGAGAVTVPANNTVRVLTAEQRLDGSTDHLQWWWRRDISEDAVGRHCFIGATASECNPKAQLSFGRFRGNDRVIYRRELR
ncbi:DUF6701 domain-containing protein [uncultured Ferrimonas sp.]|uniref:DUF6701 domain-containing protein n=1 Tax=uncultured Ferrimonas sp. TaxID=432640 RepID=UPI00261EFA20|nr:DUF6701 domain-containing protein [uncultured Ferrimonas sp.]